MTKPDQDQARNISAAFIVTCSTRGRSYERFEAWSSHHTLKSPPSQLRRQAAVLLFHTPSVAYVRGNELVRAGRHEKDEVDA